MIYWTNLAQNEMVTCDSQQATLQLKHWKQNQYLIYLAVNMHKTVTGNLHVITFLLCCFIVYQSV